MVKALLEAGAGAAASPNILFDAIDTHQLPIAEILLAAGADPKTAKHRDWLEKPVWNKLARRFGHDIREVDVPPLKWPEIVDASRGNHNATDDPQRIQRLLDKGADVNVRDYKGKTALHRASQAGHLKISKLLIEQGANLEARAHDRATPIFDAAFYGRETQLRLLAAAGADLNARDEREETALFACIRGGSANTLLALVELGADLDAINARGQSLWDLAARTGKQGIEEVRAALDALKK